MKYLTIGKYRGDDFPGCPFIISKELDSKEEAIRILSTLTSSFYDLMIVEITDIFFEVADVVAAAGQVESPVNVAQQTLPAAGEAPLADGTLETSGSV